MFPEAKTCVATLDVYVSFTCRVECCDTCLNSSQIEMTMSAISSYSDWMSQLPVELHNIPLFNLAIPGSHDSMSYDLDKNSSIIEPDGLKKFSKLCCVRKIVRRWATTQTLLRDINTWADKHPKEILILALSHFKGFDRKNQQDLHNHLIHFIKSLFGNKLLPRKDSPTLKSCWDEGKNVILSYDYPVGQHPEMWGRIQYFYGNSMDPITVESKLCQYLEKPKPMKGFFVCGLNLTLPEDARILKYIIRLCDNFPNVVNRSLPRMLQWVKEQARKTPMNIIASDIATRDQFVYTVIQLNISKCEMHKGI
ncbi:PI-PLC X domain-containing protein 1-like isoform X2 [Takifugu flavidus]|uniref:PI-PLC X domain-containing protein 1-like isoform X2 n=1 Tax=Takifugu flavidus TaxID=433684 RepID=UPI0025442021|nr:PI-PLC X domain-containing protein 1-like isoform X2 [Takifugu flavidus]